MVSAGSRTMPGGALPRPGLGRVAVVARRGGLRRHLMLLPDMLDDRENWRRLRIWLRHRAPRSRAPHGNPFDRSG